MSKNESLINNLLKKDDDFEIISQDSQGNMIVSTSLNVGEKIEEEDEEEQQNIFKSVNLHITEYLLKFISSVMFCFGIFGIVPFFVLVKHGSQLISGTLLVGAFVMLIIINILCYAFKKQNTDLVNSLLAVLLLCLFTTTFSLAAFFKSTAPLQGCIIMFIETLSVLIYCLFPKKSLNLWWSLLIMISSGFLIWIIGFIAFIEQNDWIGSALLLLFCVFIFSGYTTLAIRNSVKKYHIKEFSQIIVGFFTDFYAIPIEWIYVKYVKNNQQISSVVAEKNNIVQKNVLEKVNM